MCFCSYSLNCSHLPGSFGNAFHGGSGCGHVTNLSELVVSKYDASGSSESACTLDLPLGNLPSPHINTFKVAYKIMRDMCSFSPCHPSQQPANHSTLMRPI